MKGFMVTLAIGLLLAFGAIAAGCGDDDEELTIEEYFQRLQALDADVSAQLDALEFPEDPEDLANFQAFFEAAAAVIEDGVERLADIDPPGDVEDAHNEFSDAAAAFQDASEDVAGELEDVESASELEEVLTASEAEFAPVEERFETACLALEAIATDNGIAVDLDCEEEE